MIYVRLREQDLGSFRAVTVFKLLNDPQSEFRLIYLVLWNLFSVCSSVSSSWFIALILLFYHVASILESHTYNLVYNKKHLIDKFYTVTYNNIFYEYSLCENEHKLYYKPAVPYLWQCLPKILTTSSSEHES